MTQYILQVQHLRGICKHDWESH